MGITYFKRYRMETDLASPVSPAPQLPAHYSLLPWSEKLIPLHAEVKFRCFVDEMDASVFPCLGTRAGCRRLMTEIADRNGFLASATWLIQYWPENARRPEVCGTIQGVCEGDGVGAIQNVGVTAEHRSRGLGVALVWHALNGFRLASQKKVLLEVTAQNTGAVRLYQRLGFRKVKTVYKASEVAYA
ncbi:GNAT family N-acetyltransferase [Anatilimnocola sp. NA78]|uniref:GNAT family N-acetyltransferase n=1 Tax=Anatilimnocola sp. NA78 TaxID=3415683 RepID=UPI003CE5043A